MQTRLLLAVLSLFALTPAAWAQLGPRPSEERPNRVADIRDSLVVEPEPAPAPQPIETTPSVENRVAHRAEPRVQTPPTNAAPVSLDDALISGSRLGRPQPESAQAQPEQSVAADSGAQALGPTALSGTASNPMLSRGSITQTVLALGGVLLLIFGLAQLYKRLARSQGGLAGAMGAGGQAPSGLVEVLGRYPISSKITLVVMRFDRRVLLLSHAGGGRGKHSAMGAMTTLCELDRPEDVASVLLKVRDAEGDTIAQAFARTLREADMSQERYLDEPDYTDAETPVRVPQRSRRASQVVRNDAGDTAEFGVATESEAAAGVLRRRLAAMRPAQQAQEISNLYGGGARK